MESFSNLRTGSLANVSFAAGSTDGFASVKADGFLRNTSGVPDGMTFERLDISDNLYSDIDQLSVSEAMSLPSMSSANVNNAANINGNNPADNDSSNNPIESAAQQLNSAINVITDVINDTLESRPGYLRQFPHVYAVQFSTTSYRLFSENVYESTTQHNNQLTWPTVYISAESIDHALERIAAINAVLLVIRNLVTDAHLTLAMMQHRISLMGGCWSEPVTDVGDPLQRSVTPVPRRKNGKLIPAKHIGLQQVVSKETASKTAEGRERIRQAAVPHVLVPPTPQQVAVPLKPVTDFTLETKESFIAGGGCPQNDILPLATIDHTITVPVSPSVKPSAETTTIIGGKLYSVIGDVLAEIYSTPHDRLVANSFSWYETMLEASNDPTGLLSQIYYRELYLAHLSDRDVLDILFDVIRYVNENPVSAQSRTIYLLTDLYRESRHIAIPDNFPAVGDGKIGSFNAIRHIMKRQTVEVVRQLDSETGPSGTPDALRSKPKSSGTPDVLRSKSIAELTLGGKMVIVKA